MSGANQLIDFSVSTEIDYTVRVKQLSGLFDVPVQHRCTRHWKGELPLGDKEWNVGLLVGPSGCGKSNIMRRVFGEREPLRWKAKSVIDDFDRSLSMEQITGACSSVGFNTIPSWMVPHAVLSTGEKFRVELARCLLSDDDPIVMDEFTSVVDRQVAHIGAMAVAKFVRKNNRRFVAATCHYDVIDWLQPDWILEPATMTFQWRSLQRRPAINVEIARVHHAAWQIFAPFHYLTRKLITSAHCFVLFADGAPASFVAVKLMPHQRVRDIRCVSRAVTLPDYQGLGLNFILIETLAANYSALGYRFRNYPAHLNYVRAHDRSPRWVMLKRPGVFSGRSGATSTLGNPNQGGRPCAVFEYVGAIAPDRDAAKALIYEG